MPDRIGRRMGRCDELAAPVRAQADDAAVLTILATSVMSGVLTAPPAMGGAATAGMVI